MFSPVSFRPISVPSPAEQLDATEQQPRGIDAHAGRSHGSSTDTPAAPPVPPWLTPDNFDFLRRVAHVVSGQRG